MDDYGDEDEVLLFIAQVIVAVKTFAKGPFFSYCVSTSVCVFRFGSFGRTRPMSIRRRALDSWLRRPDRETPTTRTSSPTTGTDQAQKN